MPRRVNRSATSAVRQHAKEMKTATTGKAALSAAKALKSAAGRVLATPSSNKKLNSAAGKASSAPKTPRRKRQVGAQLEDQVPGRTAGMIAG